MMKYFFGLFTSCFIFSFHIVTAQSHYPGQHGGKMSVTDKEKSAVYAFDLHDVKLLDSRFKQNMERNGAWLLSI